MKIRLKIRLFIARLKAAKWYYDNQDYPDRVVKVLIEQNKNDYPVLYHMSMFREWQSNAKHTEMKFDQNGKITVTFSDDWS